MNRSAWWFVLPIAFGILGSAIAWSKIRHDDPELVKWIMIFGAVKSVCDAVGIVHLGSVLGA